MTMDRRKLNKGVLKSYTEITLFTKRPKAQRQKETIFNGTKLSRWPIQSYNFESHTYTIAGGQERHCPHYA